MESSSAGPKSALEHSRDERIRDFVSIETSRGLLVFSDVPKSAWFSPYIRVMAEAHLINGYADTGGNPLGKFGPADNVTIEQMAKVLVSAMGVSPYDCPNNTINLTASGSWSSPFVACAEERHWSIFTDGSVDVHRSATRSEVVVTLLQAFGVQPLSDTGAIFADVTPTMAYGGFIARAKRDSIVSGYSNANGEPTGLFGPSDAVTRAAFAKVVTGAMQVYKKHSIPVSAASSGSSEPSH